MLLEPFLGDPKTAQMVGWLSIFLVNLIGTLLFTAVFLIIILDRVYGRVLCYWHLLNFCVLFILLSLWILAGREWIWDPMSTIMCPWVYVVETSVFPVVPVTCIGRGVVYNISGLIWPCFTQWNGMQIKTFAISLLQTTCFVRNYTCDLK